jgi:uncharacterized protein YacL
LIWEKLFSFVTFTLCAFGGYNLAHASFGHPYLGISAAIGALFGLAIAPFLLRLLKATAKAIDGYLQRIPLSDFVAGAIGLIVGLVIAALLAPAIRLLPFVGRYLVLFLYLGSSYLGTLVALRKREDLGSLISGKKQDGTRSNRNLPRGYYKILDTSVIIDGRIADLCQTGFLEGVLVIPAFVLDELRKIADSPDLLKRNRGRRGLDILNKIQRDMPIPVQVLERDFQEQLDVDNKLVKLAKLLDGKVFTNDYNLNKVAEIHGVAVLNINELANAIKPMVLPGEELAVQVIKDGKEPGQGVAYLEDGTMIVVDGGRRFMGQRIEVLVTSVLQTAAGRMIFAKPKLMEKAL